MVRKLPAAVDDLLDQFTYIGLNSLDAADRFLARAEATFAELCRYPGLGRSVAHAPRAMKGLRVLRIRGFPNHQVYYRELPGAIEIVRVLHCARDVPRALRRGR
ncbi:MAG: type II toxin-antitoxin system RelE/ParE family toxin [Phycisphaerales bacterium]|nr:type II toxin-antitoxin system RelE/ParE family toxin [Phycisphaerales bacterium]